MKQQLLLGKSTPIKLSLEEGKDGKLIAKGEFGRVDVPTQNGRIYGRKIIEANIKRLNASLKARSVYGELDHPSDGKTKLSRCSHIITGLQVTEDGIVNGTAEIMSTPKGLILQEILKHGGAIGVSSRGFGTTTALNDGSSNHKVNEDYMLKTYDFVADPAMATAYPEIFTEDLDDGVMRENGFTMDMLKAEFPSLVTSIEESVNSVVNDEEIDAIIKKGIKEGKADLEKTLRQEYEGKLASLTTSLKEEARATVLQELDEDPEHMSAKAMLSRIAEMVSMYHGDSDLIAIKDAMEDTKEENEELKSQVSEATTLAKKTAYELVVEKVLHDHPFAKNIRTALGDLATYDTVEELNIALSSMIEEYKDLVAQKKQEESKEQEELVALNEERELKAEQMIESIREEFSTKESAINKELHESKVNLNKGVRMLEEVEDNLSEALDKIDDLTEEVEAANLEAYKANAVVGKVNPTALLSKLKGAANEKEVDEVVESYGRDSYGDHQMERVRERAKRRGQRHLKEDDDESLRSRTKKRREVKEGLDIPFAHNLTSVDFDHLAGVK